jgi:SAM-dependent methyltransferase
MPVDHDARRWHLSPECLYLDCWTRAFLRALVDPAPLRRVCNVGVGVGEFDDWLGYWLPPECELVSVDIDGAIVSAFRDRQARDGHPHAAKAVHADLMRADLGRFDLVTIVGSTIHETHAPALALRTAQRWVAPGGWLYATVLHAFAEPSHLLPDVAGIVERRSFTELPDAGLTAVLARAGA